VPFHRFAIVKVVQDEPVHRRRVVKKVQDEPFHRRPFGNVVKARLPDKEAEPKLPALSVALAETEIVLEPSASCVIVVVPLAIVGVLLERKS
jgi:hypothetical protein